MGVYIYQRYFKLCYSYSFIRSSVCDVYTSTPDLLNGRVKRGMHSLGAFVQRLRQRASGRESPTASVSSSSVQVPVPSSCLAEQENVGQALADSNAISPMHDALVSYSFDSTDSHCITDNAESTGQDVVALVDQLVEDTVGLLSHTSVATESSLSQREVAESPPLASDDHAAETVTYAPVPFSAAAQLSLFESVEQSTETVIIGVSAPDLGAQPALSASIESTFTVAKNGVETTTPISSREQEQSLATTFATVTAMITERDGSVENGSPQSTNSTDSNDELFPDAVLATGVAAIETTLVESDDSALSNQVDLDDASHVPGVGQGDGSSVASSLEHDAVVAPTPQLPKCFVSLPRLRIVSHSPPPIHSSDRTSSCTASKTTRARIRQVSNEGEKSSGRRSATARSKSQEKSAQAEKKLKKPSAREVEGDKRRRSKSATAPTEKTAKTVSFAASSSVETRDEGAAALEEGRSILAVKRKRGVVLQATPTKGNVGSSSARAVSTTQQRSPSASSVRKRKRDVETDGTAETGSSRSKPTRKTSKASSHARSDETDDDMSDVDMDEQESSETESSESPRPKSRKKPKPKGDVETRAREYLMSHPKLLFADAELVVEAGLKKKKKGRSQSTDSGRATPKCVPSVYVPPTEPADQQRPQHSKATIIGHVKAFCADSTTKLRLCFYQHLERLQIIRQLIARAYTDEYEVGPLLRLLQHNGRDTNDPLSMLASVLRPELINTRQSTQAGSAPLTIFNYLMPLFMQRWGIMASGTSVPQQWRSIGQMYNNWKGGGRWPELLIAAPEFVMQAATELFANGATPSEFQTVLAEEFVEEASVLAKWCYIRRSSRSVNADKTGKSLYMDLIVPPMAVWLRLIAPDQLAQALAAAEAEALPLDVAARINYPAQSVYRAAVDTLTHLLAGASAHVSFGQLVANTLNSTTDETAGTEWISYSGSDEVVDAGIQRLRSIPPQQLNTTLTVASGTPTLHVTWQWAPSEAETNVELGLNIPLVEWQKLKDALTMVTDEQQESTLLNADTALPATSALQQNSSSATGSRSSPDVAQQSSSSATSPRSSLNMSHAPMTAAVSSVTASTVLAAAQSSKQKTRRARAAISTSSTTAAICILGLQGELSETTFREILTMAGGIAEIWYDEAQGALFIGFDTADSAFRTLLGVYGTVTRMRSIRARTITIKEFEEIRATLQAAEKRRSTDGAAAASSDATVGVRNFGTHQRKSNQLNFSLLLIRPPPLVLPLEIDEALKQVQEEISAVEIFMMAADEPTATLLDAGGRFAVVAEDPYDFFGARLEFGPSFADATDCSPSVFLFLLREVVLAHLQIHAADAVFVTPPVWFDASSSLNDAASPAPLYDVAGNLINVSNCRLLLCPTFYHQQPILIFIAFPQALNNFKCQLTAPFVVLFGAGLTPAVIQSLLVFLFIRMERLLNTAAAIVRPNVSVINFGSTLSTENSGEERFQAYLKVAHAARIMLLLLSTTEILSLRQDFFINGELIAKTRLVLAALSQDKSGNAQFENVALTGRAQALDEWRTLAGIATRASMLAWNDGALLPAYSAYLVHRYLRAQNEPNWTSSVMVRKLINTSTAKVGYELATCELRQLGEYPLRAFCARIQQLHQLGFRVLSSSPTSVALCRRSTEHVLLPLPDFGLHQGSRIYTEIDELQHQFVACGSSPFWNSSSTL